MAGIKETKDQLRNEILELHKRFTAAKPEEVFSNQANNGQLRLYADLAADLAKKMEALAVLNSVEEQEQVIIPLIPEIKTPEIIVPPIPEIKKPEVITTEEIPIVFSPPVPEIPSIPEVKKPEIVQSPSQGGKVYPDLKSLIGFNEKLMFVRSLFNNDGTHYENAIAQINSCTSLSEAETVFQNLSKSRNWSAETEPVQIFHSIVKRRFA